MVDYASWAEKPVAVTSLLLDPQNPRIPPSEGPLDQAALIAELIEHDKVLELAKDIVENGYAPVESLIGVEDDDGNTYILEGNRRLAALKVLLGPEAAPEQHRKRLRALARDATLVKKVRVLYAPDRRAAAPLLMQKHTRQQIERWSPLMQARFYRNLATSGMTAKAIADQYGSTPGEVAEFLRTDGTYELARRMELPDKVRTVVHDPRSFPVSTVQRLLDTTAAKEALGIDFDENGAIVGSVSKEEFKKAFTKILSDIASEKLTTRTINTKEDVKKYLSSINESLPDKKKKGSFSASDFDPKPATRGPKPAPATPKRSAAQRQSSSLVPHGVACRVKSTRIAEIFKELRGLSLEKNPNASAVLFRILLELAVGHYLDTTKKIAPLMAKARKDNKPSDWYPPLRHLLTVILEDDTFSMPPLARKNLKKIVTDKQSSLSLDGLDAYVHNRFTPPTVRELRHFWDAFGPLFAVVLEEPVAAPPTGRA